MLRKLSAILAADVVGYGVLMEQDEAGTLARVKASRSLVLEPSIAAHEGRTFKVMGDGVLVEFNSAVKAVACALDVQRAMAAIETDLPEEARVRYRIGVNLGDLIVEDDDFYGEGVNVAARLQKLAPIGGVALSRTVIEQVAGRIAAEFEDLGTHSVKDVERPVHVFVVRLMDCTPPATTAAPGRLSICVLPFTNMSGDAEQEYFSDGISEDIITDLSKVSALRVTARNSAFTFKGKNVDVAHLARQLKVSHVLEGSVRKSGGRVRITARMIDAATGEHIWAERYDRDLTDIFAIQDDISESIVAALKLKLLPEEKEAIAKRGTTSVEAYNLYLMARQFWITGDFGDRRREERVIRLCRLATEIDAEYAQAWALLALAQANLVFGFMGAEPVDNGLAAAERAISLNPDIAEARLPKAWHFAESGEHDKAAAELETAVRLGPDSWEVNKEAARLFYRLRRIDEATRYLERATSLVEDDFHGWGMLMACYSAQGDAAGVRRCAEELNSRIPEVLVRAPDNGAALIFGALALAISGHADRAQEWIERALLLDPKNMMMRYNLAWGLAKIFKNDAAAIKAIAPVFEQGGRNIIRLAANDPNLDGLRDDPSFKEPLAAAKSRVGLAER